MLDDDLKAEIEAEAADVNFEGRKHYSRSTYADGCRGPMCRLAETHRGRERNQQRAADRGTVYRPYLERRKMEHEEGLMQIIRERGWDQRRAS